MLKQKSQDIKARGEFKPTMYVQYLIGKVVYQVENWLSHSNQQRMNHMNNIKSYFSKIGYSLK